MLPRLNPTQALEYKDHEKSRPLTEAEAYAIAGADRAIMFGYHVTDSGNVVRLQYDVYYFSNDNDRVLAQTADSVWTSTENNEWSQVA